MPRKALAREPREPKIHRSITQWVYNRLESASGLKPAQVLSLCSKFSGEGSISLDGERRDYRYGLNTPDDTTMRASCSTRTATAWKSRLEREELGSHLAQRIPRAWGQVVNLLLTYI